MTEARGFARPQGRARIETAYAAWVILCPARFARPQGRARIETTPPGGSLKAALEGFARPQGRARIETL